MGGYDYFIKDGQLCCGILWYPDELAKYSKDFPDVWERSATTMNWVSISVWKYITNLFLNRR